MREAALLGTDKAWMSRGPDHQNSNTQRRDCPLLEHRLQPMESNQHCYQHATTHTQTHTHAIASNNVHANPYLPNTHSQRTPEHTMPKILRDTYTHSGDGFLTLQKCLHNGKTLLQQV